MVSTSDRKEKEGAKWGHWACGVGDCRSPLMNLVSWTLVEITRVADISQLPALPLFLQTSRSILLRGDLELFPMAITLLLSAHMWDSIQILCFDSEGGTIQARQTPYLSVYLSVCLSVSLSLYLFVCLSLYLSLYLSGCLSIYLSIYLSVCLFVCLLIGLYPSPSHLSLSPSFSFSSLSRSMNPSINNLCTQHLHQPTSPAGHKCNNARSSYCSCSCCQNSGNHMCIHNLSTHRNSYLATAMRTSFPYFNYFHSISFPLYLSLPALWIFLPSRQL